MAYYETGSWTDVNDGMSKISSFLVANGWTQNKYSSLGTGFRLHVSKNGCYINLRSYKNEYTNGELNQDGTANFYGIAGMQSDGYNGTLNWNNQPGYPYYSSIARGGFVCQITGSIPTYHFFAYPDCDDVYLILEYSSGLYQHISFGKLKKYNSAASGGYFLCLPAYRPYMFPITNPVDGASSPSLVPFRGSVNGSTSLSSCSVRCNVASHDGYAFESRYYYQSFSPLAAVSTEYYEQYGLLNATNSPYNWQTQLLPFIIGVNAINTPFQPFGEITYMRRLNMANYTPGQILSLGSDNWIIFPWHQKGGITGERAVAIKKV